MFSDVFTAIEKRKNSDVINNNHLIKRKPPVDVYENEDAVVLIAEMPNVKKGNLNVRVVNSQLHISGIRKNDKINGEYIVRETHDVHYERIFELERSLDPEKISANYRTGILHISIGKKEIAKPRYVEIK